MTPERLQVLILMGATAIVLALVLVDEWLKRRRRRQRIGDGIKFTMKDLPLPGAMAPPKEFSAGRAIVEGGSVMRYGKGSTRRRRYRAMKKAKRKAEKKGVIEEVKE